MFKDDCIIRIWWRDAKNFDKVIKFYVADDYKLVIFA